MNQDSSQTKTSRSLPAQQASFCLQPLAQTVPRHNRSVLSSRRSFYKREICSRFEQLCGRKQSDPPFTTDSAPCPRSENSPKPSF